MTEGDPTVVRHRSGVLVSTLPQAFQQTAALEPTAVEIKRFLIVGTPWEPGGDELTPTMKLKRKPIAENYCSEIEKLYAETPRPDVIALPHPD